MLLLVSVYLIILFRLIAVPLSLLLCFPFDVCRIGCPCPCLPVCVVFRRLYDCLLLCSLRRTIFFLPCAYYVTALSLFWFCLCFCLLLFSMCLSLLCPFLATMYFATYFLARFLLSVSPPFFLRPCLRFGLVWFRLSCDHGWIRSEPTSHPC